MLQTLTQKYGLWLICSLIFFSAEQLEAQTWQKLLQLGDENLQTVSALTQAYEAPIFAVAFTENLNIGNRTISAVGEEDIFIAKQVPDGSLEIILSGGSLRGDAIDAIAVDGNNDLIVAGSFWESIDFGTFQLESEADSPKALFLIKINLQGQLLWSQVFTGGSIKDIHDLSLTRSDDILIGGYYGEELRFADTLLSSPARSAAFYAKFQSDGQFAWANSIGETGNNRITATTVYEDEHYYLAGYYDDTLKVFDQVFPANTNDADAFLLSVDQNGNFRWVNKAGGVFEEEPTAMEHDELGNVYMGGRLVGVLVVNDSLSIQSRDGNADCFLIKYDSTGSAIWAQSFGGDQLQFLNDMVYQSGGLWLTGSFQENIQIGDLSWEAVNGFDGYIAKLDTAGKTELLLPLFSANGSVLPNHLSLFVDGVLVAGDFSGTVDLRTDQLITASNVFNLFIVYLTERISSARTFMVLEKAIIIPNPSQGLFTIEGLTESYELQVTDRQGKIIFSQQKVRGPIDCSSWANGLYFLSIRTENSLKTGILVKND